MAVERRFADSARSPSSAVTTTKIQFVRGVALTTIGRIAAMIAMGPSSPPGRAFVN